MSEMDRKEAENRISYLKAVLWENSRKYYVENAPEISDFQYDLLMKELESLEEAYPEFATPDSPTRKVGSDIESGFRKFPHRYPMLSLGNTYSIAEVEEFAERASRMLEGRQFSFCCELKFDGTAICLTYRNGTLYRALTRGDGEVGDDVTANALQISNIPARLSGKGWPEEFEIRGEVLMPYASFDRLNAERAAAGEPLFANPRNAASGSLKLQDRTETGRRGLFCTLYHVPGDHGFATHDEALRAAASWGLPVSSERKLCPGIEGIEEYIAKWDTARKSLPFATDGIVIKINEMDNQALLGYTAKFPRWAVAYKFKAEQALTPILSVDYQVGRTGAVTPVANLAPVSLSGTTVKRATLINEDQIALLDIHEGDWVYVEKGGEIIPKITAVEPSRRSPNARPLAFPEVCPDCGTPLVKAEGEAKYFCPNADGCPMQIKGALVHFLSRKAMNVLAGDATVDQMYEMGLVKTPADFYSLSARDLVRLDGWKEKSAERFLSSLKASLEVPFSRVLYALGIRFVGETTAKALADAFGDIDSLKAASREELVAVGDIGTVIADSVWNWMRVPAHIEEIERLRAAGVRMSSDAPVAKGNALEGLTIVISGNFSVSREEMKALIEMNGGKNSSSVSSKTSYLLAGTKSGPEKLRKAAELGVEVIDEDRFRSMIPSPGGVEMADKEPTLF